MAAVAHVMLIATLFGCSDGETKAAPELPERICWNVFARADVAPLLPAGEKATLSARPFGLVEDLDSATCTLDIDGVTKFTAYATLHDFEDQVDWAPWAKARPETLDVGTKGIIWYDGAASYIVCEPSKTAATPGKYIDLHISTSDLPDEEKLRKALPALMRQFVAFTQKELNCR
jgi:hypothetical protein